MKLIFLGTNGWYSTNESSTICTLIDTPSRYIVLDAGEGIHHLDKYIKENKPIDIFLSHFHLDHTFGFHILPKFRFKNKIRIFSQKGAKKILDTLVNKPFTASFQMLASLGLNIEVRELSNSKNIIDDYVVHTLALVHADPCWGFRFELNTDSRPKVLSYCTDTGPCENMSTLSKDADILITECSLLSTDKISDSWPHMTPQAAAKIAKDSNVSKLIFTHFVPDKYPTIDSRKSAVFTAKKLFENTICATDGFSLDF